LTGVRFSFVSLGPSCLYSPTPTSINIHQPPKHKTSAHHTAHSTLLHHQLILNSAGHTIMASNDSLELRSRLEGLPQELYDMIFALTFTATSGVARVGLHISRKRSASDGLGRPCIGVYKSMPELALGPMQVSSATRAQYSASHYENTVYVVENFGSCKAWLDAMPQSHRLLLRDLCIPSIEKSNAFALLPATHAVHRQSIELLVNRYLTGVRFSFVSLGPSCLYSRKLT
jgi:hypothetical protein